MEQLKHECGVAMIRLLKPLSTMKRSTEHGCTDSTSSISMEKQHNRGQEGAGLACVKLEASPGEEYMFRERALGSGAITEIFGTVQGHFKDLTKEQLHDADYAKRVLPFAGGLYGAPALLHYRKVRHLVRAPVPPEKQLACQESCPLRQLQHDECG